MPKPSGCSRRWPRAAQVQQPLIKTFFASRFGMVADRFGVRLDGADKGNKRAPLPLQIEGEKTCDS